MDRVSGKVALVTGGAQGLGRAIAELLAREGAHVVISDIQEQLGASVAETVSGSFVPHDVAQEEDWKRVIASVIAGSGGGSIVNLSSMEGIIAHPEMAAYNASKGGVRLLTKSAALYCGKQRNGVRVNSVHPAFAWGPLLEEYLDAQPDREVALAELQDAHPIGRLGDPEDVAYGVLYLASDESKWVTGTELVLDGGWTAA